MPSPMAAGPEVRLVEDRPRGGLGIELVLEAEERGISTRWLVRRAMPTTLSMLWISKAAGARARRAAEVLVLRGLGLDRIARVLEQVHDGRAEQAGCSPAEPRARREPVLELQQDREPVRDPPRAESACRPVTSKNANFCGSVKNSCRSRNPG